MSCGTFALRTGTMWFPAFVLLVVVVVLCICFKTILRKEVANFAFVRPVLLLPASRLIVLMLIHILFLQQQKQQQGCDVCCIMVWCTLTKVNAK